MARETVADRCVVRFTFLLLATLILLLSTALALRAQEAERPTLRMSLKEAMELALTRNFDIQIQAMSSQGSFVSLAGSYGVYDLTFSEDVSHSASKAKQSSAFRATQSNSQSFDSTLSRRFFTGANASTTYSVGRDASNSIMNSLNPQFSNSWRINLTQPVLRDFGRLPTERQIMINKNNVSISDVDFESQVIRTLVDLEGRYWSLVMAYEGLKVAEEALSLALEQYEINKVKVAVGTLPEIELIAAEEQVASREADLVDDQATLRRAEDNLKQAIVTEDWDVRIEPTDKLQEIEPIDAKFEDVIQLAYERRPEMKRLELQMQNDDISISYARNQLKPSLDINAGVTLSSYGGSFTPSIFTPTPPENIPIGFGSTLWDLFSLETNTWNVGATFTYVFGNEGAKATLLNNQISRKQNTLRMEQTRYSVAVDVREALRELDAAVNRVQARKKALDYAERQLEAERRKFEVGTSTNFQVLEYQNQLISARYNLLDAQVRYQTALVSYDRALGSLLMNNKIEIKTSAEGITGAAMR